MTHLTLTDLASRSTPMADKPLRPGMAGWKTKKEMRNVGGSKGKLHRELGIPEGQKIPAGRLEAATHSDNPEIRRDAIRAKTMEGWDKGGGHRKARSSGFYTHPRSPS